MYETTRDLVAALERAGELTRVAAKISPILAITEVADRMSKSAAPALPSESTRRTDPHFHHLGGRAVLFENVEGSDIPVLINQFGSYRRMEIALGCNDAGPGLSAGHTPGGLAALAERLAKLIKPEPPPTLLAKLQKIPELLEIAKIPPKRVRSGICQEVVHTGADVDLTRLPLIRCWPLDGDLASVGFPPEVNAGIEGFGSGPEWDSRFRGRYITLGGVHTIHRDDLGNPAPPSRNIGMYRVQLFGPRRMAMHWHMHHDGARHWRSWKARGERMPVAIALGGESVLPYAATAPMPPGISELLLAGFLNRGAIPLVPCKTVPLDVPANSEIVIEGYVSHEAGMPGWDPRDPACGPLGPGAAFEGPFGDHTGFYSLPDRYPILDVTAITHRRDPIYPTIVVGLPPQEDYFLGKATERLFLPLLKTIIPDIIDYDLPMFGAFHNCAFVQIRKEYPLQARRVMCSVWGAGQMAWTKTIVVVDEDVDVHDTRAVLRAIAERCEPGRDVMVMDGPLDILDHAAPYLGAGSKMGFDATRKIAGEQGAGQPCHRPVLRSVRVPPTGDHFLRSVRAITGVRAASMPPELNNTWLFISVHKSTDSPLDAVIDSIAAAAAEHLPDHPLYTILLGPEVDVSNLDEALFHWCANFDARRDTVTPTEAPDRADRASDRSRDRLHRDDIRHLVFDAMPKSSAESRNGLPARDWPPIIRMVRGVTV